MMAEINRDVLRSIILDVLQEMGGVHEAPQTQLAMIAGFKQVVLHNLALAQMK